MNMIENPRLGLPRKWEIVYFVTSRCNNNCGHCWSKNNFLGKEVGIEHHRRFFEGIDANRLSCIKLSGGECSLYNHLPDLISLIRSYVPNAVPLILFSNGRFLFDASGCVMDVHTIMDQLSGSNCVELHVSVDEYHIECFAKSKKVSLDLAALEYNKCVRELIGYSEKSDHVTVKFKLHCNIGRSLWHRHNLFQGIDEDAWKKYFIVTEGLIKAGNAQEIKESTEIKESDQWSAFVLNGVTFEASSNNHTRDIYDYQGKKLFLNESDKNDGVVVLGWWNLINHKFYGGTIDEFKQFLSR